MLYSFCTTFLQSMEAQYCIFSYTYKLCEHAVNNKLYFLQPLNYCMQYECYEHVSGLRKTAWVHKSTDHDSAMCGLSGDVMLSAVAIYFTAPVAQLRSQLSSSCQSSQYGIYSMHLPSQFIACPSLAPSSSM